MTYAEASSCCPSSAVPPFAPLSPSVPPDPPLYASAKAAIRFAVNCEGAPARPLSSRMADTLNGRGIAGLDRAAQAGYIMGTIECLGTVRVAVLIAETAVHYKPCHCRAPCCSGRRANSAWREALDVLTQETSRIFSVRVGYALRSELIAKVFSKTSSGHAEITLKAVADDLEVDVDTVSKHHKALIRWLNGAPRGRHGEPPIDGVATVAWREAESLLRACGIVG
jgi:hypothetical protein